MNRLITNGLMFGNLILIDAPALVERYNRALKQLTGQTTTLTDFHIDLAGYSPEVADALNAPDYLCKNGLSQQFILLTTDQKDAPLLNAKFSTWRSILSRFISENEGQLFALTARDAVTGAMDCGIFDLASPARLFEIRHAMISADTIGQQVAGAQKLNGLIARFRSEEDAWFDADLIGEMAALAAKTGDITRNPVTLKAQSFVQENFWTAHFGGMYLFRAVRYPAVIVMSDRAKLSTLPIAHTFDLSDTNQIAKFLEVNDLAEPIVRARDTDGATILRQKMDFILVDTAARAGMSIGQGSRNELRALAASLGERLPPEFQGLAAMLRWAETGGAWPKITSQHPAYFYTLRAKAGPDRDLVNRLLAELSPLDLRQLFICHKELFYSLYLTWPDAKQTYAADFLSQAYKSDSERTFEALFGPQSDSSDIADKSRDIIDIVGPWGAVRKDRR